MCREFSDLPKVFQICNSIKFDESKRPFRLHFAPFGLSCARCVIMTLRERYDRWRWSARLARVEKLLLWQQAGAVEVSAREARFIESLRPDELVAKREAQIVKRWREDAIYSLNLEAFRLRELLKFKGVDDESKTE